MSQDIQLRNSTALPAAPEDVFGAAGAGMMGPAQPSPAAKVHRLLRGRYGLAITLGLIGATVGTAAGWFSQRAEMRSDALLQIDPIVRGITNADKVMAQYETYLRTQPYNIMTPRVVLEAMSSEEWKKVGWEPNEDGTAKFRAAIAASAVRGTQNIVVSFSHPDPEVAQTGVRAVVKAYAKLYADMNGAQLRDDLRHLESMIDADTKAMRAKQEQIISLSASYGSDDLSVVHDKMQQNMVDTEVQLLQAQLSLEKVKLAQSSKVDAKAEAAKLTPEDIAVTDATMAQYLARLREQQFELSKNRYGAEHPMTKRMEDDILATRTFIDGLTKTYREKWVGPPINIGPGNTPMPLTEANVKWLEETVAALDKQYQTYRSKTQEVGRVRTDINKLNNEIGNYKQDLEKMERNRDEKLVAAGNTGILRVISDGDPPLPATDKRKQMAFVGFVGGGALPVALLLLIGMLDHRYRYSEEASTDLSGVTLLGILPNLPDRLTDPDQAATAAHCVHQIRTMLQINGGGSDDPQVFCVTSAQPGDGKTSLTLALALSFAASGSRTLLVDCDLVGAGLTARLDMGGPEGVLEAMTNRSLLEYIRQTDIADLAMLPVGSAQAHHAGLFSPAALRRLVTEAKKHFEVVLIDTGPILGSIEATPVCAAADAVILTVARGQQRPLVEKALQHLMSIGARFAGVVFNRAQTRDFERSISGMSLRSVARHQQQGGNGNGHGHGPAGFRKPQEKTFGPVARAVASSFNPPPEGQSRDNG